MNNDPNVSIIILNWNGWEDTIECLESIFKINYPNYSVIVVDNGSEDDSIKKIKDYCNGKLETNSPFFEYTSGNKPINFTEFFTDELETNTPKIDIANCLFIMKNKKNYGFADGNNIGIRFALNYLHSDYFLLLNNDTVVDNDFINDMVKVSESDDKIGLVGPKIYSYDRPKEIQSTGFEIRWSSGEIASIGHTEIDNGQFNEIKNVDCVSGCAMLVKKEVIQKLGDYLDHEYFLYYEDMDACVRVNKAGYEINYVPGSKIWHKTSSTSKKASKTAGFYTSRNVFIFMKKYATKNQYSTFLIYYFLYKLWYSIALNTVYYRDLVAFIPVIKGTTQGLKWKK
ncbi:MAG TPA: glycosyltransferase family 2 protein [Methanobacterium sp.]|nr:glycosyltransferase family 2 protein [Methanobacterium sp.]